MSGCWMFQNRYLIPLVFIVNLVGEYLAFGLQFHPWPLPAYNLPSWGYIVSLDVPSPLSASEEFNKFDRRGRHCTAPLDLVDIV